MMNNNAANQYQYQCAPGQKEQQHQGVSCPTITKNQTNHSIGINDNAVDCHDVDLESKTISKKTNSSSCCFHRDTTCGLKCRASQCIFLGVALIILAFFCFLSAIFAGHALERRIKNAAPLTTNLYNSGLYCAYNITTTNHSKIATNGSTILLKNETAIVQTISAATAQQDSSNSSASSTNNNATKMTDENRPKIGHCGACGECSTLHDVELYAKTRQTLTRQVTTCALNFLFGKQAVSNCLKRTVGFTPSCLDCWVDNIFCTAQKCKFSCLRYRIFNDNNNNNNNDLNDCLDCDERLCGPAFLNCAGANRRTTGLISDIGRDLQTEQCREVEVDWVGRVS